MNLVPAEIVPADNGLAVRIDGGTVWSVPSDRLERYARCQGRPVIFGLRPESFAWRPEASDSGRLDAVALVIEPLGSDTLVFFNLADTEMAARLPPDCACAPGQPFSIYPDLKRMHLFDAATGSAL
jgi:multiple sugar transport system ATP-binding protein